MTSNCTEINAWNAGCSSVEASTVCDSSNGEQRFVATVGQELFTLAAFSYAPGTDSLAVHRNGLLIDPVNVTELSPTTFFLQNETVLAGDIVVANALTGVIATRDIVTTDFSTSEKVLTAGQLIVNFGAAVPVADSALYVNGPGVDTGRLILGTDYSIDTINNIVTLVDSYPAGTILLLAYNDVGTSRTRMVSVMYDFAVDGGLVGKIALDQAFPDNSTITRAYYETLTTLMSLTGAPTISFGIDVDDPTGLLAPTAFNNAIFILGYHPFLPDGTITNFTTKSTAVRDLIMEISGATLSAGKIQIWYEYITSS
jgi:hypothetical protein